MWTPGKNQKLSEKESLGRRLFGDDVEILNKETTAKGKAGSVRIDHFIETRSGYDLSVDRLGVNAPDQDVLDQLGLLGEQHSETLGKRFAGWAVFIAKHAMSAPHSLNIDPTPNDDNKYHADVRLGSSGKIERNKVAFVLATISDFRPYQKIAAANSPASNLQPSWLARFMRWLGFSLA